MAHKVLPTTSAGTVQNSLISDIVAAQLQFEPAVVAELNKRSLAKAESKRKRWRYERRHHPTDAIGPRRSGVVAVASCRRRFL